MNFKVLSSHIRVGVYKNLSPYPPHFHRKTQTIIIHSQHFGARQCPRLGENLVSPAIRGKTASSDVISGECCARAAGVLSASENPFSPLRILRSVFSPCVLSGHKRWVGGGSRDQRMIRKKRTRNHHQQKWTADEDPTLIQQELHLDSPENTVSPETKVHFSGLLLCRLLRIT